MDRPAPYRRLRRAGCTLQQTVCWSWREITLGYTSKLQSRHFAGFFMRPLNQQICCSIMHQAEFLMVACAAAKRAAGTRNGEQDT